MSGTVKHAEISSLSWIIRPMQHDDILRCLDIWREVGLVEAFQTVASSLATDPEGFNVAQLVGSDEVIGMCAGPKTREDSAFMGFYAVLPRYQNLGIGRELWARTINRLDHTFNIGLYGVPSMSEKYKRTGFVCEDHIRMLVYETLPDVWNDSITCQLIDDADESLSGHKLMVIDKDTEDTVFRQLVEYDQQVHMFSREQLLRNYLRVDSAPITLAVLGRSPETSDTLDNSVRLTSTSFSKQNSQGSDAKRVLNSSALSLDASNKSHEQNSGASRLTSTAEAFASTPDGHQETCRQLENANEILGYGCIRTDNTFGAIIGPIYANSDEVCELILKNLIHRLKPDSGARYSVMALDSNHSALNILSKVGFVETDQCTRMFTKFVPEGMLHKIYFVHSPNFTLF